ncbi:uncharacterized protein N7482_001468 [Penicillium canariense]|uniref:Uncharacterized protein n=1 Tax=Penicillium canariense TaxID=189055 RepID=A0A9W9IH88_9EURO|nr:uncharacterized protein N7482_001468 [Penicillium canariense]KAJ5175591.1 hypothetical protein N7482_001468 [Penicillium canariense]
MRSPGAKRTRFYNCDALSDQTDILDSECTGTDVASVWNSILSYWFPPEEGYQLRLNHTEAWVEVYVIRVAVRPCERDISFSPVFVVRCYGARADVPGMPTWDQTMADIPSSVTDVCRSVNGSGRPAFGAIACADVVRLCAFHPGELTMDACDDWPGMYFISLLKNDIKEYLDHVKANFAKQWGHPYSYYCESDDSPSPPLQEMDGAHEASIEAERGDFEHSASDEGSAGSATRVKSEDANSMETSNAGSTDLNTDSDLTEALVENRVNGHVGRAITDQGGSPSSCKQL